MFSTHYIVRKTSYIMVQTHLFIENIEFFFLIFLLGLLLKHIFVLSITNKYSENGEKKTTWKKNNKRNHR